jgi:hypothetical protein
MVLFPSPFLLRPWQVTLQMSMAEYLGLPSG